MNGETTAYEYGLERIAAYTGTDAEQIKTQYVYDVRGSVIETVTAKAYRDLSEATATPAVTVQGYAYTPYGEQIGSKISGYGYNGEYYDAAAGMLNLRARQYEPAQMRFSQPDIVRGYAVNPQSVNRYAYCVNNPVMYEDPSGKVVDRIFNTCNDVITAVAFAEEGAIKSVSKEIRNQKQKPKLPLVNNTIKVLNAAQREISSLDENSLTYDLEKDLILSRACAKLNGDDEAADTFSEYLATIQGLSQEDWLFISGGILDSEDFLTRVSVLNRIKKNGGTISLDELVELGVYQQSDLPQSWWDKLWAKLDFTGGVYHFADLLEGEYVNVYKHGTTFLRMDAENWAQRIQEQQQLVRLGTINLGYKLVNYCLYGPNETTYDLHSSIDRIELSGWDWGIRNEQGVPSTSNVSSIELFRAVSPEEFYDIMKKGKFDIVPWSYEGKQFGFSLEETYKFADKVPDAAAIVRVTVPKEQLYMIMDDTPVDTTIFRSGTVTIPYEELENFNNIIINIFLVE